MRRTLRLIVNEGTGARFRLALASNDVETARTRTFVKLVLRNVVLKTVEAAVVPAPCFDSAEFDIGVSLIDGHLHRCTTHQVTQLTLSRPLCACCTSPPCVSAYCSTCRGRLHGL